ncbi:MAG: deoxyribodipyrimidine photolyase [Candidatus Nanosalina sp. J07AB43]|nr:MAG: deoxyribodipyrimidine photolyase [Candidatus Nanosalina sp. J07AB43]
MKVVIHRRDLRTKDNKAVEAAGEQSAPVYVFDPDIWSHPLSSDSRQEFILDSLRDLNRQYMTLGTELSFFHGDIVEVASELESNGHKVMFNKDSNHFYQQKEKNLRKRFEGVSGNAVETKGRSRGVGQEGRKMVQIRYVQKTRIDKREQSDWKHHPRRDPTRIRDRGQKRFYTCRRNT